MSERFSPFLPFDEGPGMQVGMDIASTIMSSKQALVTNGTHLDSELDLLVLPWPWSSTPRHAGIAHPMGAHRTR